jgi:hypothetical protein
MELSRYFNGVHVGSSAALTIGGGAPVVVKQISPVWSTAKPRLPRCPGFTGVATYTNVSMPGSGLPLPRAPATNERA